MSRCNMAGVVAVTWLVFVFFSCKNDQEAPCIVQTNCIDDSDCPEGTRCNQAMDPPQCFRLYCGPVGRPCSDDVFCENTLICSEGFTPPTCRSGAQGDRCNSDDDCTGGSGCLEGTGECGVPGTNGDSCRDNDDNCAGGLLCISGHRNTSTSSYCDPPSDDGEVCSYDDDCVSGLVCNLAYEDNDVSGSCMEPGGSDILCDEDEDCLEGYWCSYSDPEQCALRGAIGAVCHYSDNYCQIDLVCNCAYECEGSCCCEEPGGEGGLCVDSADCLPSLHCGYDSRVCEAD